MENLDIRSLAESLDGEYIEQRDYAHDGTPGDFLVFQWEDEDNSEAFVEACSKNEIDIVHYTEDYEDGILTTCVMI
jgi:hypothetical protein